MEEEDQGNRQTQVHLVEESPGRGRAPREPADPGSHGRGRGPKFYVAVFAYDNE